MPEKKYENVAIYEKKLEKVMARLGVEKFDYDYSRRDTYVEFWYEGQYYRFEHTLDKAQANGQKIQYGSDLFSQVVLSLEDIARMTERGIYKLSAWIAGLKALPPAEIVPECFKMLGFDKIPDEEGSVDRMYKQFAKAVHPDTGGSDEAFRLLQDNYEQCKAYLKGREKVGDEALN